MFMDFKRLPPKEFNFYFSHASFDKDALGIMYPYCTSIIKTFVLNNYGFSNFYDIIPHDVFTKIVFDRPPNKYIKNPTAYLCRAARNHMCDVYRLKDNQTLELSENYSYIPEYEDTLEFTDEATEKAWYKLDELSRYILYMTDILDYPLEDVAEIVNKSYESVKSKKWRARTEFKNYIKQFKQDTEINL